MSNILTPYLLENKTVEILLNRNIVIKAPSKKNKANSFHFVAATITSFEDNCFLNIQLPDITFMLGYILEPMKTHLTFQYDLNNSKWYTRIISKDERLFKHISEMKETHYCNGDGNFFTWSPYVTIYTSPVYLYKSRIL